jgi:putative Holliday junction resolvase
MVRTAGRVLGIDYGHKRVGVAVSDPLRIIAQGIGTIKNDADLMQQLQSIRDEYEVALAVVGMPLGPENEKGRKALEIEAFIRRLVGVLDVPVDTWDESFSSVEAQRILVASGMKKKRRRKKGEVDVMAARVILQEYLDAHS